MREPLKLVKTGYTREQVLEMLRKGEIEPTRKALEGIGRSEQQAKTDLKNYKKSGGANHDRNPRINGRGSGRSDRESHISEVESDIGGSEGIVPSRRQESASSRALRNTAPVEPTQPKRVTNDALPPIQPAKKPHLSQAKILKILLVVMSIALSIAVQWLNWDYSSSFGLDTVSGRLLGAVGILAGLGALLLAAVAYDLWTSGPRGAWAVALLLWCLCIGMEFLATSGFFGRHFGNTLKEYGISIEDRHRAELRLAAAQNEFWQVRAREQQIQDTRARMGLRADEKATKAREKAQQEVDAAEATLHRLPVIASQDPSADIAGWWTRGWIGQEGLALSRVSGWTAFACLGPGILMFLARVVGR